MSIVYVGPHLPIQPREDTSSSEAALSYKWRDFFKTLSVEIVENAYVVSTHDGVKYNVSKEIGDGFSAVVYLMQCASPAGNKPPQFTLKVFRDWEKAKNDIRGLELVKNIESLPILEGMRISSNTASGKVYIAMPPMEEDLFAYMEKWVLSAEETCGLASVIARTAAELWDKGIALNDIKLENVGVYSRGPDKPIGVRLFDFGCFIRLEDNPMLTITWCHPNMISYNNKTCTQTNVIWQIAAMLVRAYSFRNLDDVYGYSEFKNMKRVTSREGFIDASKRYIQGVIEKVREMEGSDDIMMEALEYAFRLDSDEGTIKRFYDILSKYDKGGPDPNFPIPPYGR